MSTRRPTFAMLVARLNKLRQAGQQNTPEYAETLRQAQRANPNPRTPVGFYLSDYSNTRD